jgi:hypothetical protein
MWPTKNNREFNTINNATNITSGVKKKIMIICVKKKWGLMVKQYKDGERVFFKKECFHSF